ncbi:FtsE-like ATP binding protein in cell division [Bifidobacterium samirii]|uniref:Cell division ATP-binding protein FtsE n=1 Tax=Bifidobacterium samirii TaxID=2306974 RepID=A0A430FWP3_9BIFI|nr:cell division ATP-binding protein FtsE [Bifidobacterium samirii]RSX58790.1 FtsE-like ATP binding protein in cell division [Bifidobacterium samirii]
MSLISLDHVSKIYPRGTRPALDDVNLHIDRGEFVFLVGASGSGKTTLLSLMLREEEATDGEIHVAGHDLRRLSNRQVPQYRRSLGFIFQDYKLLDNKTVWQNVAFALEVIGTRRSTIKSLVPKVLETVGLTGKENSYPQELSGGEQQRVTIARAYVNHPDILLADEPTGNLDPTTSLGIMEVLEAINRTGTTIVMATHNEEIVNSMRKRVVELHAGKIVRDERNGSYDSALYFPDAQVEAKSQQAIGRTLAMVDAHAPAAETTGPIAIAAPSDDVPERAETRDERERRAAMVVEQVSQAVNADTADEGIARLASSVHSGRTGRYGEAFAPVETTLTWGRGLRLDEYEASLAAGKSEQEAAAAAEQAAEPSGGTAAADAAGSQDAPDAASVGATGAAARAADGESAPAVDTSVPDIDLSPAGVSAALSASESGPADGAAHDMPAPYEAAGPAAAMPPAPPAPPMPPAPPAPRADGTHEGTDDTKGDARR